jgi:hypothetical protein
VLDRGHIVHQGTAREMLADIGRTEKLIAV